MKLFQIWIITEVICLKKYFDGPVNSKFHPDINATIKNEFLKTEKGLDKIESLYVWFLHNCLLMEEELEL